MAESAYSYEVTQDTFDQEVIRKSNEVPVMVDFWADWCAPCRTLMPLLAKLADEYQGQFLLAKVNTDKEQQLAAAHGIRSLPTVRIYKFGEVVEEFMGVQPEAELRQRIEQHLLQPSDNLYAEAMAALESGDNSGARTKLEQLLAEQPGHRNTTVSLARLCFEDGDYARAEEFLKTLSVNTVDDPEVLELKARLGFVQSVTGAPEQAELEKRIAADPKNSEARYQLGAKHVLAGNYEQALEQFLAVMQRDRQYGEDAARKGILAVFDILGGSGPLVNRYRAKMASLLH